MSERKFSVGPLLCYMSSSLVKYLAAYTVNNGSNEVGVAYWLMLASRGCSDFETVVSLRPENSP